MKPILASNFEPLFFCEVAPQQVRIFWHWVDYLAQECAALGKIPCYINLDETSVARCLGRPVGFLASRAMWPGQTAPRRRISKQLKRAAVTHVVLMTNLPQVQPKLPQFFLCNRHVVPVSALKNPALQKPPQVEFWRGVSGWNSVEKMEWILAQIRNAMLEFPDMQTVLLLDVAMCHIHPRVAAAAERLGIWLVFVPAKLTFLVQPLDVYALAPYKACLAKLFAEKEDEHGVLDALSWLQCLCKAATTFWCARKWLPAFEKTGVVQTAGALTVELEHAGVPRVAQIPFMPPSREDIEAILPRGRFVPHVSLFWHPARLDPPLLT